MISILASCKTEKYHTKKPSAIEQSQSLKKMFCLYESRERFSHCKKADA